MTRLIFVFIAANVVIYLGLAFIAWEINPANWTTGGRLLCLLYGGLFGVFAALTAGETK
jgi:hypothetical protein